MSPVQLWLSASGAVNLMAKIHASFLPANPPATPEPDARTAGLVYGYVQVAAIPMSSYPSIT
ncbi:hypothetical protein ColKHC_00579 [Colletotrichum higginsianum]|nr:hypothetical protein ColKHC_00579 [Colletotrichum higginsianum]